MRPMTVTTPIADQSGLDGLRAEIDSIDRQMQELLIRRFEVTREVANLKQNQRSQNNWRPNRQAQLLRGLVTRHRGTCPQTALIRIWQEIMGASLALQGPFSVGVALAESGDLWDLARDHFGNVATMGVVGPAPQVVGAVSEGDISVGVVPLPQDGEDRPW
ncbi:MAG: chorismate mutase, partial [Alphaproteobacteria bacterium]|nr:chorismate mutase [Alphaproteobacteria bacterium]